MVVGWSVGSDKYLTFSFCRSIYRSLSDHLRPRNNVQVGRRDGPDRKVIGGDNATRNA